MKSGDRLIPMLGVILLIAGSAFSRVQASDGDDKNATPVLRDAYAMEAYFSWDGKRIIYQGRGKDLSKPLQVFVCDFDSAHLPSSRQVQVTDGPASHECTFFSPDGRYIVFATGDGGVSEKDEVDFGGYPYFYDMTKEIYVARLTGDKIVSRRQITENNAYEAETSFSPRLRGIPGQPDGTYILYTSSRDGNLDLWMQRVFDDRGREVKGVPIQLTRTPTSQEGGAFFLSDHEIVYRTWEYDSANPKTQEMEKKRVNYRPMQIHVLDIKTGKDRTVTSGNARNWAPFPHPSGKKIVFAKRDFSKAKHGFDIFVMDLVSGAQEQMTFGSGFEGYPVFHPSGDWIMYSKFDRATHLFNLWTIPYPAK